MRRGFPRLPLAAAVLLGAGASAAHAASAKALSESNGALLDRALIAASRQLVERAPLAPGTRVALAKGQPSALEQGVERALLAALTERRMEVYVVSASAAESTATSERQIHVPSGQPVDSAFMANLRAQQQELSAQVGDPANGAASPAAPAEVREAPLLTFHVEEARVDYPRLYRSGLFGGLHVERRALGRLSARLLRPGSRAVYWVGAADTSIADHVPRSELKMLEDPARTETRGTVPPQGWKKLAEPALVIGLVVGLVSLFYTNRP